MNQKFRFSKKTANGVTKITAGTLLGQGISFVTLPILTRLYGAHIIGIWAVINSISLIFKSFSDLGLTNSIMLVKDEQVEVTYRVISTVSFITSALSSIMIALYLMDSNYGFIFYYLVTFFSIFVSQQIQVTYTWLNRNKEYNVLMWNPIITNLSFGIIAIIFGVIGLEKYGYFFGFLLGQFLTLLHMKSYLPKKMFVYNTSIIKSVIYENVDYVKYQMPSNVFSNIRGQVPIFIIKMFWGTSMVGYYSITVKLLQIPVNLLANAIGRVFFSTSAKLKRDDKELDHYVLSNFKKGLKIGIIPIAILMGMGDFIVIIFLGKDWTMAGEFIMLLSLKYFFMFMMTAMQGLAVTINKQKYTIIANALQISGYLISGIFAKAFFDNIYYALFFMAMQFIVINIVYFGFLFKEINISIKKYIQLCLNSIFTILFIAGVIRFIVTFILSSFN